MTTANGAENFARIAALATHSVALVDANGKVIATTKSFDGLFGCMEGAPSDKSLRDFAQPIEHDTRLTDELVRQPGLWRRATGRKPDGRLFPIEIAGVPWGAVGASDQPIHLVVGVRLPPAHGRGDEFEPRDAMGLFASRIGHALSNQLTPFFGFIELARMDEPTDSALQQLAEKIIPIGRRLLVAARNIRLLRPEYPVTLRPMSCETLLERSLKQIEELGAAQKHTLTARPPGGPVVMLVDSELIRQMIVNLVINAAESMRSQGAIELLLSQLGNDAEIRVSDGGVGVPDDLRDRVFEPFFTTNANGRNLGLGLTVARSVVERHGGSIELRPNQPQGTTVVVRLPLYEGE